MSQQSASGSIFVVAAPSGAGKSSLVHALLKQTPEITLSISTTTRAPRPGEENGREYFFISQSEFLEREKNGEFLESASVHGNFYGTSRLAIEEQTRAGKDVLLEIDWQGAQQVRKQFPGCVGIFILPPSVETLEQRLRQRGQDTDAVIGKRVQGAAEEIAHAPEFDYVIINENFEIALSELVAIARASRCRLLQQAARHSHLFAGYGIQTR